MRKLKAFLILSLVTLIASSTAFASDAFTVKLPHKVMIPGGENVVYAGEDKAIINGTLINLRTKQSIGLSIGANEPILDVNVLTHPGKIIILTRSKERKLMKYAFGLDGKLLQKTFINILLGDSGLAKWTPPDANTPEKVWVQRDKLFAVYKAPWKRAEASYDSTYKDNDYEYSNVIDWTASSPYLVLEYDGAVIMGSQRYVSIVNMNDKSQKTISIDQNPFMKLHLRNRRLAVTTNWYYQDPFPANVEHPDSKEPQPVYSLINLNTGNREAFINGSFEQSYGEASGWETELYGSQVYVRDLHTNQWSLYDLAGSVILSGQPVPQVPANETVHFLGYKPAEHAASFVTFSSLKAEVSIVTIDVQP